jgi:hypothetical protein
VALSYPVHFEPDPELKIAIYISLGLHKGHPSYRRSFQLSKENIQHFKR